MGIEPTKRRVRRSTGFEDRGGHQSRIHSRSRTDRIRYLSCRPSFDRALQDSADERLFILRQHGAQIDQRATFLHSGEHGRIAQSQLPGNMIGTRGRNRNGPTRQASCSGRAPPPGADATACSENAPGDGGLVPAVASTSRSARVRISSAASASWRRTGISSNARPARWISQRRLERGERQLVDTQGPGERI